MKHLLSLISLFLACESIQAQDADYRPFIEEGKVWMSQSDDDMTYEGLEPQRLDGAPCAYYIEYNYFDGDTIVGGTLCKRWIQNYVRPTDGKSVSYVVPVYEEDKKVWFFFEEGVGPFLMYDFGAQVGDTIVIEHPGMMLYQRTKKVDSIDWLINSWRDSLVVHSVGEEEHGCRNQLSTHFYTTLNDQSSNTYFLKDNYFMQGIGSHWAPRYNNCFVGQTIAPWLLYCSLGSEILYVNEKRAQYLGIPLPTSITAPHFDASSENRSLSSANWTDLSGRHLSAPPTRKGVYIREGKKVLIK